MPLDAQQLCQQIEVAAPQLKINTNNRLRALDDAIAVYKSARADLWKELILNTPAKFSLAYPKNEIGQANSIPTNQNLSTNYTVIATDGSVIPPDRHSGMAYCHVINIGRVMLRYGQRSEAEISSKTMFFASNENHEEIESSVPRIIDLKRDMYELVEALDFGMTYQADLVMCDGPLTMWSSRTLTDRDSNSYRENYYNLLTAFGHNQIPVVGYISNPYSQSVTNSLRLLFKQQTDAENQLGNKQAANLSNRVARGTGTLVNNKDITTALSRVRDAMLFDRLLEPGQYSEVYQTSFGEPQELSQYMHEVCFLYWKAQNEIVRLEFPRWLVEEPTKLLQALCLIQDQYLRGQGYPVALMEAHECAVLRGEDRELLRIVLEENDLLEAESEKSRSKRLRNI